MPAPLSSILRAPTPEAWVATAIERWRELLVDHANCEKKAASTALALIFAYPEDHALAMALSRLAREELRHFEQVQKMMITLGVDFERQQPGRYASGLRTVLRTSEPGRKLDLLLAGALIEARHFELYVNLARAAAPDRWRERLETLAQREAELVTEPDPVFRFHSGLPPLLPGHTPA